MADTSVQHEVEAWIVQNELPRLYGQPFAKGKLELTWGGLFEFDAVSEDSRIAVCISTSSSRTESGKLAYGKIQKIKADALYLLNARGLETRVLVFTERSMLEYFEQEGRAGRFPSERILELRYIELPKELREKLERARLQASAEVSPG